MTESQYKINRVIGKNTSVIKGSDVSYSSVQIFRRLVRSEQSYDISLSESDLKILESYNKGVAGLEVLKSFKPRFMEILDSPNPDAIQLGQLMSDSRVAEQEVYQRQIDALLSRLSPEGRKR